VRKGASDGLYGAPVVEVLRRIWLASEQPCGKRLVAMRELWLPPYEQEYGKLTTAVRARVRSIGAAQADRLRAPRKVGSRRGRCATKPGEMLKHQISTRPTTEHHPARLPGGRHGGPLRRSGGGVYLERHLSRHLQRLNGHPRRLEQLRRRRGGGHARRGLQAALALLVLGCDNGV
jgi:hypothetical protein